jgi:hypothetical protein
MRLAKHPRMMPSCATHAAEATGLLCNDTLQNRASSGRLSPQDASAQHDDVFEVLFRNSSAMVLQRNLILMLSINLNAIEEVWSAMGMLHEMGADVRSLVCSHTWALLWTVRFISLSCRNSSRPTNDSPRPIAVM